MRHGWVHGINGGRLLVCGGMASGRRALPAVGPDHARVDIGFPRDRAGPPIASASAFPTADEKLGTGFAREVLFAEICGLSEGDIRFAGARGANRKECRTERHEDRGRSKPRTSLHRPKSSTARATGDEKRFRETTDPRACVSGWSAGCFVERYPYEACISPRLHHREEEYPQSG